MSPNVAMGRWPLRSAALKDPPSAQLLNRGAVVDDPVAPQRPQRRSLRSPELQRRPPNRNITKKEAGAPPRRPAQVEMRRARLFGDPRQGIKNTIRQPEMSERESTPLSSLRRARSSRGRFGIDPVPHHAMGRAWVCSETPGGAEFAGLWRARMPHKVRRPSGSTGYPAQPGWNSASG